MNHTDNWQKLLNGEVYNDFAKELFDRRVKAKKLFRRYNVTGDEETALRTALLKELLHKVGENVWIEPDFRCEYGSNITIGDNVYINFECIILDCSPITIGNDVLLGPRVGIYSANHSIDAEERIQGGCYGRPISIGDKVWIGGDVRIMGGVSIGEGSVIGAGSVVTKDIPAGVIAAGVPYKVIRPITEADKTGYKG